MSDDEDLRREIADVDEQLRVLRGESNAVADQVGGQAEGAQDSEDVAAALTNSEENGALIDLLQQRRETLEGRLAQKE